MDNSIPAPPTGFTMDSGSEPPAPPAGFKLDSGAGNSVSAVPPPPAGFKMDQADPYAGMSGWDRFTHGIADPNHPNFWNVVYGLNGAYKQAATSGLMSEPVRAGMEALDYGGYNEKMRQAFPNASDAEIKAKVHDLYNQSLSNVRQDAYQQTQDNKYAGHQVANFAASVLGSADPTWFINPGGAVEKQLALRGATGLAARVGANAAAHAAMNSAGDDAAQLMDMAEGVQKDYDIKRNLTATALGGAFGAAHGTLSSPVVSDFVSGLFKNRGIDTTPAADPRVGPTTEPLTTDHQPMSPAEQAQFKELIRSGSVDDIKNFMAGRQGPQPTWQQVNAMVELRDRMNGQPQGYMGQENFNQAMNETLPNMQKQLVENHIANVTKDWKNAPDVEVINHVNDIQDPAIRQQAIKDNAQETGLGFLGSDGKVRIFADRMTDPEVLNSVLYHESLGHFGLSEKFGDRLDSTIQTLLDRNVGSLGRKTDEWIKENPGAYGGDRVRAAEEVLARQSENGPMPKSWLDAVSHNVKQFGRQMGLKLGYSDNEVAHILSMAHDAVINGKGRNVGLNGFRTKAYVSPTNKFMFTGENATGFNPDQGFTASDGRARNEISDANAKFNDFPAETTRPLGQVLDHPELFKQYPHLADVPVTHTAMEGLDGAYSPKTKRIYLNTEANDKLSTVLHEAQHAIQDHENYPGVRGGDTLNSSDEEYHANPLEKEAQATEARRELSEQDRMMSNPPKFMRRSDLVTSPDYHIQQIERAYQGTDKDYMANPMTFAAVKRDAIAAGFSPSQIKDFGSIDSLKTKMARMIYAAKALDSRLAEHEEKITNGTATMNDMDSYRQMIADHNYILQKIRGDKAEIARALAVSKLGYTRKEMQSYAELLKENGGTLAGLGDSDTLLKFAKAMKVARQNGANPAAVNSMVTALNKPNWEDYVTSWHQNMMLSALSTHVKAPQDMMIGIGREILDSAAALPIGTVRSALRALGAKVDDGVHPMEAAGRLYGAMKAVLDANTWRDAAMTFANKGQNPSKFASGQTFTSGTTQARIPVVSKVTDLIAAQDSFFRAIATNMHLYGLGAREAVKDMRAGKISGSFDDISNTMSNHALYPSSSILEEAKEAADRTLLLNRNELTKGLSKLRYVGTNANFAQRLGAFINNFLAPFVRVSMNSVMNRIIARSPLSFLDAQTRADFAAGGARADTALARTLVGTASIAMYWMAAKQGKVVGEGPANANKRKELEAGGFRPESVPENGTYNTGNKLGTSLNPFDVHNQTATMVADMRESYERGASNGQVLSGLKLAMYSVMKDLAKESYYNDMHSAMDPFFDNQDTTGSKIDKFAGNELSTMLPNAMGQYARVTDQATPDISDHPFTGSIAQNIPGLRDVLPVKYSVYGTPMAGGATFEGQHGVFQGNHVNATTDPTEQELERLSGLIDNALVTPVQKTFSADKLDLTKFDPSQIHGDKVHLTSEQFENYQRVAGRSIVEAVRQEMSTPEWQKMSDQDKVLTVKDIQKDMKAQAKEYLFGAQ